MRTGVPARTLFSGVLRCATCLGPIVAINSERYGCGVHKDRGSSVCASEMSVPRQVLERRLLGELRAGLLEPAALAEMQSTVRELLADHARQSGAGAHAARKRLATLGSEISRLVDAVAAVGLSDALRARLQAAEAEQAQLEREIGAQSTSTPAIADVMARYRRQVLQLQQVLAGEEDRAHTRQVLADLLGTVVIGRDEDGIYADLVEPAERLLLTAVGDSVSNVGCGGSQRTFEIKRIRVR
jgi:site-specific DNA recombinase